MKEWLAVLVIIVAIVGCGDGASSGAVTIGATNTAVPRTASAPSGLTVNCILDAEQLKISCHAAGYRESSQLKWTSTASWADSGGSKWEFTIDEDLVAPTAQVQLEVCQGSNCRIVETSIDTSALASKKAVSPATVATIAIPSTSTSVAIPSSTPKPSQAPPSPTPSPQPILRLPFTTEHEPGAILPMGETILHTREAPWGHPGIDFLWDRKVPMVAAAAGEVGQVVVDKNEGGHHVSVFTGAFTVVYHVLELYVVNPGIDVGSQITAGQVIGYPSPANPADDNDNWHSTHWAFGRWQKHSPPITTPEGLVMEYTTDYLCPIPYFIESERNRFFDVWGKATYPGSGNEREHFPDLCNGPYKNY